MQRPLLTSFFLLVLTPTLLLAQTLERTPVPTSPPSALKNDFASLEFNLLETGYKITPDPVTRNKLITAGEKALNTFCIADFSAQYQAQNDLLKNDCAEMRQKVIALDPANPAAICTESGINSTECLQAYSGTELTLLTSYAGDDKDLEAYLASDQTSSTELQNKIAQLMQEYSAEKTVEKFRTIIGELYQHIPSLCSITRYHVPQSYNAASPTLSPSQQPTVKPFENVLRQLSDATLRPTPTPPPITRYRLVSNGCLTLLEQLKNLNPTDALYLCTLHGPNSPQCLKAQKLAKQRTRANQGQGNPLPAL